MDDRDGHGSKVVSLGAHREAMRFPPIAEVRAYWEALRAGRPAPYRSEVDPRGIERSLEYAFVLERLAPQVARFRIAGMALNDLAGMEVRGMPVGTLFTPAARREAGAVVEAVFAGPCTAELSLSGECGFGRPALSGRMLLLPLRSDLGDVSRILGCLVTEGRIGRAPRRFEIRESLSTPVPIPTAERDPVGFPATPPSGFAEPAKPFADARRRPQPGLGHLRLVVTDG